MNSLSVMIILLGSQITYGATKAECISGNFAACEKIIRDYGSTSDKTGATEFFSNAWSSQNLSINCQIISVSRSETLKKSLELAGKNSAQFIVTGSKVDKIYLISSAEK